MTILKFVEFFVYIDILKFDLKSFYLAKTHQFQLSFSQLLFSVNFLLFFIFADFTKLVNKINDGNNENLVAEEHF